MPSGCLHGTADESEVRDEVPRQRALWRGIPGCLPGASPPANDLRLFFFFFFLAELDGVAIVAEDGLDAICTFQIVTRRPPA